MFQYPSNGPVISPGYPQQQPYLSPGSVGSSMQPGHNLHPMFSQNYSSPNLQYYQPYSSTDISSPSTPAYSRTPSPSMPSAAPPMPHASSETAPPWGGTPFLNGELI